MKGVLMLLFFVAGLTASFGMPDHVPKLNDDFKIEATQMSSDVIVADNANLFAFEVNQFAYCADFKSVKASAYEGKPLSDVEVSDAEIVNARYQGHRWQTIKNRRNWQTPLKLHRFVMHKDQRFHPLIRSV